MAYGPYCIYLFMWYMALNPARVLSYFQDMFIPTGNDTDKVLLQNLTTTISTITPFNFFRCTNCVGVLLFEFML